jgi:hypothetical protein
MADDPKPFETVDRTVTWLRDGRLEQATFQLTGPSAPTVGGLHPDINNPHWDLISEIAAQQKGAEIDWERAVQESYERLFEARQLRTAQEEYAAQKTQARDLLRKLATVQFSTPPTAPLIKPPGAFLGHALSVIFPRKAFEHTFAQHINDYRDEIYELLAEGRLKTARWRTVQLNLVLIWNAVWFVATGWVEKALSLWKMGN